MPVQYMDQDEYCCAICGINSFKATLCYHPDLDFWRCEACNRLAIEAYMLGREVGVESGESVEMSEPIVLGVEVKIPADNSKAVKEASRLYREFLNSARRIQATLKREARRTVPQMSEYRKAELRAGLLRALELAEAYKWDVSVSVEF